VVGSRAVTSTDGITADFFPFDMKFLDESATRIINEVKGVNRVVYDVTSKPPGRSSGSRAHTQFSTLIPGMRLNSRILLVTTIKPSLRA